MVSTISLMNIKQMKRIVTLTLITLALVFNTTTSWSQDKYKNLDESAKRQSAELTKVLDLDNNQAALVWRAIYSRDKAYVEDLSQKDLALDENAKLKSKIDNTFKSNMMKILTDEQFKTYTSWLSKQKL